MKKATMKVVRSSHAFQPYTDTRAAAADSMTWSSGDQYEAESSSDSGAKSPMLTPKRGRITKRSRPSKEKRTVPKRINVIDEMERRVHLLRKENVILSHTIEALEIDVASMLQLVPTLRTAKQLTIAENMRLRKTIHSMMATRVHGAVNHPQFVPVPGRSGASGGRRAVDMSEMTPVC